VPWLLHDSSWQWFVVAWCFMCAPTAHGPAPHLPHRLHSHPRRWCVCAWQCSDSCCSGSKMQHAAAAAVKLWQWGGGRLVSAARSQLMCMFKMFMGMHYAASGFCCKGQDSHIQPAASKCMRTHMNVCFFPYCS
jgi:hypothetical protein